MLGPQGIPSDWICTGHISPRRNKPSWSWLRKTHRNEVWHTQKTCKVPENISVCKTIHRYYMVLPWINNAPGCLICGVVPFYWSRLDMIILQEMAEAISSKNHHVITLSWVNFWSFLIRYTCFNAFGYIHTFGAVVDIATSWSTKPRTLGWISREPSIWWLRKSVWRFRNYPDESRCM